MYVVICKMIRFFNPTLYSATGIILAYKKIKMQ
jgi:hypothetical protein